MTAEQLEKLKEIHKDVYNVMYLLNTVKADSAKVSAYIAGVIVGLSLATGKWLTISDDFTKIYHKDDVISEVEKNE